MSSADPRDPNFNPFAETPEEKELRDYPRPKFSIGDSAYYLIKYKDGKYQNSGFQVCLVTVESIRYYPDEKEYRYGVSGFDPYVRESQLFDMQSAALRMGLRGI